MKSGTALEGSTKAEHLARALGLSLVLLLTLAGCTIPAPGSPRLPDAPVTNDVFTLDKHYGVMNSEMIVSLVAQEIASSKGVTSWYFLKFSDAEAAFRGVVIVEAYGPISAIQKAANLSIDPGGTVHCVPTRDGYSPSARLANVLLTQREFEQVEQDESSQKLVVP